MEAGNVKSWRSQQSFTKLTACTLKSHQNWDFKLLFVLSVWSRGFSAPFGAVHSGFSWLESHVKPSRLENGPSSCFPLQLVPSIYKNLWF